MKKKNKGKKALTAVGAVVAAGLTPGIIAASPMQGTSAEATAADVVTIDGMAYGFDELFDQQPDSVEMSVNLPDITVQAYPHATRYGAWIKPIDRTPKHDAAKDSAEVIYRSVEQMPRFPGGEAALMKYLNAHIRYPASAVKDNIEGHVIVQFVVKSTGEVGEVKVVHTLGKELDREAVRVVKSLPKFIPGRHNGQAVSVWYTLPVTFRLPQENNY